MGISISGLLSTSTSFDWQSVVDQLIAIESKPITRLQTEEAGNVDKLSSFAGIKTGLEGLQKSVNALSAEGLFDGRSAAVSNSSWKASAESGTATGSYTIAVSQLATAARRTGASSIAGSLNAAATDRDPDTNPNGIGGLTLASLPTATAITSGESFFTVNGKRITINSTDSLQSVFAQIASATNNAVTASYNASTDKITLASDDEIVLGAANDTSNFLSVMRLANNGTDAISSSSAVGSVSLYVPLSGARLGSSYGSVDTEGKGSFTVNGVSIDYDVDTDSINAILNKITNSTAGVSATYDKVADRVILTNKSTGDTGMDVTDVTGSLASALGLTSGYTTARGSDAQFTVNGGEMRTSASNLLDAEALGVTGLAVTVNSEATATVDVTPNATAMRTAIDNFISAFNDVQDYIDSQTEISKSTDGTITAATLSGNREVQEWARQLRSLAFSSVSGLSGTIARLEDIGIDFNSSDSTLTVKNSSKLDAALTNKTADVAAFFGDGYTGFAAGVDTYLDRLLNTRTGPLATQINSLNEQNADLEEQVATLQKRIENSRTQMETSFRAMEQAQSAAATNQKTLENTLKSLSGNSNN